MFGYVRTQTAELRVREHEAYRATYCGLCRSMGKCTGQCSRLTLNYDFAFLALVRIVLAKEHVEFEKRRCLVHPLRKRPFVKRNAQLDLCAGASALLCYYKLCDDAEDEKGIKRLRAVMALPWAKRMRKKAIRRLGLEELDRAIAENLSSLRELERSETESIDRPAELFGRLLAETAATGFSGNEERIARKIGYHIGRWIYIVDALDDYAEDKEKGRYNPFVRCYDEEAFRRSAEGIADGLKNELIEAEQAFDLLESDSATLLEIINNIIYLGMPATAERILHCRPEDEAPLSKKKGRNEHNDGSL